MDRLHRPTAPKPTPRKGRHHAFQTIAILTAIRRAQDHSLDGDVAVLDAIAIARRGMGEAELLDSIAVIVRDGTRSPSSGAVCSATEILRDVDFALAVSGALGREL